jgi:hypothetical protein
MSSVPKLYFFKCSVSEDLAGACLKADGSPLPTPGGGKWLPMVNLAALGNQGADFDRAAAMSEIEKWGCHWFTSNGPRDIYWGPDGAPQEMLSAHQT